MELLTLFNVQFAINVFKRGKTLLMNRSEYIFVNVELIFKHASL